MSHVDTLRSWKDHLTSEPYRSYLYSYPHKTAYRTLETKLPLSELWNRELADTFFYICIFRFAGLAAAFAICSLCLTKEPTYMPNM